MKRFSKYIWILVLLLLLGGFIYTIDKQLIGGFLSNAKTENHYQFLLFLLIGVGVLIGFVLYSDKKSSS